MLAAARIGAVVVPFTTFATAPEMRDQLVHSDVAILLAAASHRGNDFAQAAWPTSITPPSRYCATC